MVATKAAPPNILMIERRDALTWGEASAMSGLVSLFGRLGQLLTIDKHTIRSLT
jgi:hypothetical protein